MEINKDKLYIDMLQDLLQQKKLIMDELITLTIDQKSILEEDEFQEDLFDKTISEKGQVLKKLEDLDQGFEILYKKITLELNKQRYQYKEKIENMQQLIQSIVEKSIRLRSIEIQNQNLLNSCLSKVRNKIRHFKLNSQAVTSYYKNMTKLQSNESYFMDNKR